MGGEGDGVPRSYSLRYSSLDMAPSSLSLSFAMSWARQDLRLSWERDASLSLSSSPNRVRTLLLECRAVSVTLDWTVVEKTRSTTHRKSSLEMAVGQRSKVKTINPIMLPNRYVDGVWLTSGGQKSGSAFGAAVCKTQERSATLSPCFQCWMVKKCVSQGERSAV